MQKDLRMCGLAFDARVKVPDPVNRGRQLCGDIVRDDIVHHAFLQQRPGMCIQFVPDEESSRIGLELLERLRHAAIRAGGIIYRRRRAASDWKWRISWSRVLVG